MLTMKVFRQVADPATYEVVGHDGPRSLAAGVLNGFPASIAVKPGDILGLNTSSPGGSACTFNATGSTSLGRNGDMTDGESEAFGPPLEGRNLNISAVFVPSNAFTLGKTRLNRKKGTLKLTVNVPNPGTLQVSGKGVKALAARSATTTVDAPGAFSLLIKTKGGKRKMLNRAGKVRLKVAITYAPIGGDPSTQSRKLKLKKR